MPTAKVKFLGDVQGVGFRYTAKKLAWENRVAGWVQNRPDGSVEMSATASDQELNRFLSALISQFENHISDHSVDRQPDDIHSGEFEIKR